MDSRVPQLLLLLMLVSCGVNDNNNNNPNNELVPNHCKFMLLQPKVYQRWCVGSYPSVALAKHKDKLINVGEPYALYLPLSQDTIMVLHKKSPLLQCRNLMFKDRKTFFCLDRDLNRTLSVVDASLFCLNFHMRLPDDLMNECLKQNDFQHGNQYPLEVLRTRKCILHYTHGEEGAQSLPVSMVLPFLAVLIHLS